MTGSVMGPSRRDHPHDTDPGETGAAVPDGPGLLVG
jgi:hypothetical protein